MPCQRDRPNIAAILLPAGTANAPDIGQCVGVRPPLAHDPGPLAPPDICGSGIRRPFRPKPIARSNLWDRRQPGPQGPLPGPWAVGRDRATAGSPGSAGGPRQALTRGRGPPTPFACGPASRTRTTGTRVHNHTFSESRFKTPRTGRPSPRRLGSRTRETLFAFLFSSDAKHDDNADTGMMDHRTGSTRPCRRGPCRASEGRGSGVPKAADVRRMRQAHA